MGKKGGRRILGTGQVARMRYRQTDPLMKADVAGDDVLPAHLLNDGAETFVSEPLRLGDTVFLKIGEGNGFLVRSISTHGHGLSVAHLSDRHQSANYSVVRQAVPYPPDVVDAAFLLHPAGNHACADKLRRLQSVDLLDSTHSGAEESTKMLMDDLESEQITNNTTTKHQQGAQLKYGDAVQLWHSHSSRYISSTALSGDQPSLIELEESAVVFRFCPAYRANRIGDPIHAGQPFILRACDSELFIGKSVSSLAINHPHITKMVKAQMGTLALELTAQVYKPYSQSNGNKALTGGAVVELRRIQNALSLCVNESCVDLQNIEGTSSLWWVEQLVGDDPAGSEVHLGDCVQLRHFKSDQYLYMEPDGKVSLIDDYLAAGTHLISQYLSDTPQISVASAMPLSYYLCHLILSDLFAE